MATIQLIDAYRHLVDAEVVLAGTHRRQVDLRMHYLTGEDEHSFVQIVVEPPHSDCVVISFWEGMNQTVEVEGNVMFLIDSDGQEVRLALHRLQNMDLESR